MIALSYLIGKDRLASLVQAGRNALRDIERRDACKIHQIKEFRSDY